MAMDGGTNPYLQQQLDSAISGAVDRATSQYALGGRLGSDSFAGALGAGISNAAAPILAQNLQQDRQNQLAAAQALGNVSGQDLSREATLGQNIVGAGQTNLANQVDATRALSAAFGQNLGQNTDIANNLLRAQQADLSRQLGASQSLASNQLDQTKSSAAMQLQAAQALPAILAAEQSRIGMRILAQCSKPLHKRRLMLKELGLRSKIFLIKTVLTRSLVRLVWAKVCLARLHTNRWRSECLTIGFGGAQQVLVWRIRRYCRPYSRYGCNRWWALDAWIR